MTDPTPAEARAQLIEQEAVDILTDLLGKEAARSGTNCRVVEDHLKQLLRNVDRLATPSTDARSRGQAEERDAEAALRDLLSYVEARECVHEDTHRGGAIWTICDGCGAKWADDEGGFQPYEQPAPIANAYATLAAIRSGKTPVGEGRGADAGFAEGVEKAGEAQANLVRMAEAARQAQARAEEAFDLIAPWVAKFAAAVTHYAGGVPQFPGSTVFMTDPEPSSRMALTSVASGPCGPGSPVEPTIGDLRMLADAYAAATVLRSALPDAPAAEVGHG